MTPNLLLLKNIKMNSKIILLAVFGLVAITLAVPLENADRVRQRFQINIEIEYFVLNFKLNFTWRTPPTPLFVLGPLRRFNIKF